MDNDIIDADRHYGGASEHSNVLTGDEEASNKALKEFRKSVVLLVSVFTVIGLLATVGEIVVRAYSPDQWRTPNISLSLALWAGAGFVAALIIRERTKTKNLPLLVIRTATAALSVSLFAVIFFSSVPEITKITIGDTMKFSFTVEPVSFGTDSDVGFWGKVGLTALDYVPLVAGGAVATFIYLRVLDVMYKIYVKSREPVGDE